MNSWSTNDVSERERFSYWSDMVCARFMQVQVDRTIKAPFRGTLKSAPVGNLLVNTIDADHYKVGGSSRLGGQTGWLFVNIHHKGVCRVRQAGREQLVAGAEMISLNAGITPFELEFPEPFSLTCFRLPYENMAVRVGDLPSKLARPLPLNASTALLSGFGALLSANAEQFSSVDCAVASETFADLLALSLNQSEPAAPFAQSEARRVLFMKICSDIRTKLGDPQMRVGNAALAAQMAPRTLQKLFKEHGRTWSEFLLDARLQTARSRIADRNIRMPISQIAYATGFSDLSYFNRTFKKKFGMSPSSCRKMNPLATR